MKQLFLKSNLLHIRTNEGEFEVSNPEEFEAAWIPLGVTIEQYFKSFEGTDLAEWPGEVEIKNYCASDVCDTYGACEHCREPKKLARLLPKECGSDYKEFEGKDLHIVTPESSEPQENQELKEAVAGQETLALDLCRCMDLLNRCYWNMITFVPSDKTMSHAEWMDCLNELELFRTEHPPTKFSNVKNPVYAPSESQEDDKFEAFFSEFQERYAFQVPYNGTNEFYNQKKLDQAESFKMDMKFAWDKIFTRKPE